MLFRRFLRYVIVFLSSLLVMSLICLYQYRDAIAAYFSDSVSSAVGIGVYLLIYAGAFLMLFRAVIS